MSKKMPDEIWAWDSEPKGIHGWGEAPRIIYSSTRYIRASLGQERRKALADRLIESQRGVDYLGSIVLDIQLFTEVLAYLREQQ